MAGVLDFLMGAGPLKKAAQGETTKAPAPIPQAQQGVDVPAEAQKAAARAKASVPAPSGNSPLSTTMTPVAKTKGK